MPRKTNFQKNSIALFFINALIIYNVLLQAAPMPLPLSQAQINKLASYFNPSINATNHTANSNMANNNFSNATSAIWQGNPILIMLPINQEKRVLFPDSVSVNVQGQLNTNQLQLLNDNGSVYFTAKTAFAKIRLLITLKQSKIVVLVDIVTSNTANADVMTISVPNANQNTNLISTNDTDDFNFNSNHPISISSSLNTNNNTLSDIAFIRDAWQQLYAPQNAIENNNALTSVKLNPKLLPLFMSNQVMSLPITAFNDNQNYITIVLVKNLYAVSETLKYSQLNACIKAASAYPGLTLQPHGKAGDSTYLFLITKMPLIDSLGKNC